MPTTEHFAEKNIIYGMKNITLDTFFKPLILAYFQRKNAISPKFLPLEHFFPIKKGGGN